MSLVKICGITRAKDAEAAVELGADLLGLNFWPGSSRYLEVEPARRIARAVGGRVPLVGVFVDSPPESVKEVEAAVGLDLLQFHGDEGADEILFWGERAIQVQRLRGAPRAPELAPFAGCWGFLFEIHHEDYGGRGKSWDYSLLADSRESLGGRPYLVAGGIAPGNARRALAASGADGVDVCSGVESAPGIKDHGLMERLLTEVHDGESHID